MIAAIPFESIIQCSDSYVGSHQPCGPSTTDCAYSCTNPVVVNTLGWWQQPLCYAIQFPINKDL
jgi:hypothetical protein